MKGGLFQIHTRSLGREVLCMEKDHRMKPDMGKGAIIRHFLFPSDRGWEAAKKEKDRRPSGRPSLGVRHRLDLGFAF
jgi:hypothetical protein